jgi:hypothetical protein
MVRTEFKKSMREKDEAKIEVLKAGAIRALSNYMLYESGAKDEKLQGAMKRQSDNAVGDLKSSRNKDSDKWLPKKSEQPIDASQAMPGGVTIPQEMQRDGMSLGFGNEVAVALSFRSAPSNESGPLVEAGEKQEMPWNHMHTCSVWFCWTTNRANDIGKFPAYHLTGEAIRQQAEVSTTVAL